ncbi:diguanylate cyclase domain-containing protein [Massilia sp. S19_KUP03_FR1]|uniref:diguanylate cyclase domain-containing protein n=1 Tax=Massilia sp. S19_KUP03_FR1 TaxID=3025503 RepID=UPI002FCDA2DB
MKRTFPKHENSPELTAAVAASVFYHSRDAIMITALDGTILGVNAAFSTITGYTAEEVRGQNPRILKSGRQDDAFYQAMWQAVTSQGYWQGEAWNRRKDGSLFAERITLSTVPDGAGRPHHYIAVFADITGASEQRLLLEERANYDALTGLPNRVLLRERLDQVLAQAHEHGMAVAVAFIDLDGFKDINDSMGHVAGDSLLATMAQRLRHALRESDTLARFGGDEFVAVLPDVQDGALLASLTGRMSTAARVPVVLDGRTLCLSASIGVALYPDDGATAAELIGRADAAMYTAKRKLRGATRASDLPGAAAARRAPAPQRAEAP